MAEINTEETQLNELKGDLFACAPGDALVHCVSQDLSMSKGIAVEFKKRFSSVSALKAQNAQIGQVAFLQLSASQQATIAKSFDPSAVESSFENRFVYYMITKQRYFHKPTMESFKTALIALRDLAVAHKVSTLSMPRIGCGLDKLEWPAVKKLLLEEFKGTGIVINVYSI